MSVAGTQLMGMRGKGPGLLCQGQRLTTGNTGSLARAGMGAMHGRGAWQRSSS